MKWKVESRHLIYKGDTEILAKIYRGGKQRTRRITVNYLRNLLLRPNKYGSLNDMIIRFMTIDLRVNPYKIKDFKKEIMREIRNNLP